MRKATRYLYLKTETLNGVAVPVVGRSQDHPEDSIKVVMHCDDDKGRQFIVVMPRSQAQQLARSISSVADALTWGGVK